MKKVLLSAGLALMASFAFAATNSLERVLANGTAESMDQNVRQTLMFAMDISKFKRGNNPPQYFGFCRMTYQAPHRIFAVQLLRTTNMQIESTDEGGKKATIQGNATVAHGSRFIGPNTQGSITIVITDNPGSSGDSIKVTFTQTGFPGLARHSFTFDGSIVSGQLQIFQRVWQN